MCPWWLRPPLARTGSVRERSGSLRVISVPSVTDRNRLPGVTGLNFLMPIYPTS